MADVIDESPGHRKIVKVGKELHTFIFLNRHDWKSSVVKTVRPAMPSEKRVYKKHVK